MTFQIGYLSLLCDKNDNCNVIDCAGRKSKRVVRSIMGGELHAFTDAFNADIVLAVDLSRAVERKLPIQMFTDSKQVFDVITRGKSPTEKRLAVDVTAARDAYRRFHIDRVGLVRGEHSRADALSKAKNNNALQNILANNKNYIPAQEQIIRTVHNKWPKKQVEPRQHQPAFK